MMVVVCFQILCCCCLACSSKICSENVSTTEDMVTVRWIPEANATYQLNVRPRPVNGDTKTINVDSNVLSNDGFASQTINGLLFGTNYELTLQKKTAPIATVLQCVFYTGKPFQNFGFAYYLLHFLVHDFFNEAI